MRHLFRLLGRKYGGSASVRMRQTLVDEGLSTEHWPRRGGAKRWTADEILVKREGRTTRKWAGRLREALTERGRPYVCETCGNPGEWMGAPMTLDIDHVNGDKHDNRQENLRYLCPNCHRQTPTWGSQSDHSSK